MIKKAVNFYKRFNYEKKSNRLVEAGEGFTLGMIFGSIFIGLVIFNQFVEIAKDKCIN